MRKIIKNNYKIIIGFILGLIISATTVYAVEAYIESNKVTYNNHNKENVQEALDELYEKSGIHKNKWTDPILNGADPVLKSPLIPVEIKNNGDVYYANLNSEWYNYSEKRWANAVILIDEPSNQNYGVGDHILESDIESYFVWIPRYQYKVWNIGDYASANDITKMQNNKEDKETSYYKMFGNPRIIDIKFGDVNKISKMAEPNTTGVYYTHPAFTLGNKDLNGIWVGKFETGYKEATSNETAQIDKSDKDMIVIKPDAYSWRGIIFQNMFMTSYNYDRKLDSHMMKNTEWGAVAYLSHSQYGIGTEVNINNTSDYKTGYSSTSNADQSVYPGESVESSDKTKTQPWNSSIGYLASTTGNISGIYDMSGCSNEYVAAYIKNYLGVSGFNDETELTEKYKNYLDIYDMSASVYQNRKLGDATGEIGPFYSFIDSDGYSRLHNSWYIDLASFPNSDNPWFIRGGYRLDGALGGQFTLFRSTGRSGPAFGFRISLAVT